MNTSLEDLANKMRMVRKVDPAKLAARTALNAKVEGSLVSWRSKGSEGIKNLKLPDGSNFSTQDVDLAGWIHEYADANKLSFNAAMSAVFEYLKQHPKALEKYTRPDLSFSEAIEIGRR